MRRFVPRPPVHPMWRDFTAWLHLPAPLSTVWWQALSASRWSTAVVLRQNLVLAPTLRLNTLTLIHQTFHPAQVLGAVEDLVHQHLLSRQQAAVIEGHILAVVKPVEPADAPTLPASLERALFGKTTPAQKWA